MGSSPPRPKMSTSCWSSEMALTVTTLAEQKEAHMPKWKANRDLYTDKDGMQVEAGDPKAAFLLAREGRELTEAQMKQHKVKKKKPGRPKAEKKAEDKAVKESEDKSG